MLTIHIVRLLVSEIHLGYVIYGKTRNLRGSFQLVDKEDWIKVKGTHEPLKTQEEHERILAKIAQNNILPKRSRNGLLPLSGLLYCAKCGRGMQFKYHVGKTESYWTALCVYKYPDGTKCNQKGRKLDAAFYHALYSMISKVDTKELEMIFDAKDQYHEVETLLEMRQKELGQIEQAIEKLFELYEGGDISKRRLSDRMAVHEKKKSEAQQDIEQYRQLLASSVDRVTLETIEDKVSKFKELWSTAATSSEQNQAYKLLIDKIVYDRDDDGITLEVLYK